MLVTLPSAILGDACLHPEYKSCCFDLTPRMWSGKKSSPGYETPCTGCNVKNCTEPGNRSCHQSKNDNRRNKNLPQHVCVVLLIPRIFYYLDTEFPFSSTQPHISRTVSFITANLYNFIGGLTCSFA